MSSPSPDGPPADQRPADEPWGIRSATFADPAGYVWEISQDLDESTVSAG